MSVITVMVSLLSQRRRLRGWSLSRLHPHPELPGARSGSRSAGAIASAPRATSARRPQRQLAHDLSRVPQQRANERARIEPDPASPTAAGHGTSRLFSSRDSSTGEGGVCPSCHAQPHRLFRRPHAMVAGSTPIPLYCRAIRLRKI